jgi:hypothetical protein
LFGEKLLYFQPGADVMILKIFSPKKSANKLAFLTHNRAEFCKNWIITLISKSKRHFFLRKLVKIAENCDRPQAIEISIG